MTGIVRMVMIVLLAGVALYVYRSVVSDHRNSTGATNAVEAIGKPAQFDRGVRPKDPIVRSRP